MGKKAVPSSSSRREVKGTVKPKVKAEPKPKVKAEPKVNTARGSKEGEGPTPGMTLQQKIDAFRKLIVSQKASGKEMNAKVLLRQWFTDGEMSSLWGKLKRFMKGQAKQETKDTWAAVDARGHRDGKVAMKNNTLALMLAYPTTCETHFVSEATKIEESKSKGNKTKYFYRGELEQIHGIAECDDFISRGKYEESEDSDGDMCYKKTEN